MPLLPRPLLPTNLEAIEFVLVDRATMTQVHADFLDDPTDTDVITFPYGEIVICPAVARDQAKDLSVENEILLYGLHGLLHLAGYDDRTPETAAEMHRAQDELLKQVLAQFE